MNKSISHIASAIFSDRIAGIEPDLRVVPAKDADLVAAIFRMGRYDANRRFWVTLAGLKGSDNHFCLRVAWTNVGTPHAQLKEFVVHPPFPSSGIADLRDQQQLSGIDARKATQHELWLGFVPDDVAERAAAEFLASDQGRLALKGHQDYEKTLKRPRTPSEVEAGIKIATVTNAGTWTGLMKMRPLSEDEIAVVVAPMVEDAVALFRDFGSPFLRERLA